MELRKKFNIILWAFILLFIFNITTFFIVFNKHRQFYKNQQSTSDSTNMNCNPNFHQPQRGLFAQLIIDELQLSPEQQQEFRTIQSNFITSTHQHFDSIRIYNDLIDTMISNNDTNQAKYHQYCENIGRVHVDLKENFITYYFDIQQILDDNQKKKLFKVFSDFKKQRMFAGGPPDAPPPHPFNGQGHRYRHGQ